MGIAIVTGASSGIGLSVSKKLIEIGHKVYGIARDFSKTNFINPNFIPLVCDVTNTNKLITTVRDILEHEDIYILVNNAGVGYFGPHETIKPEYIEGMVKTNLLAPLVLTHLVLRSLKKTQGYVINIASITALHSSRFGCAYAATKAGLHQFGDSLFDEVRKSGVKVVTIYPDITQTPFYENLSFRPEDDPLCYITPECIAETVENILSQRKGTVITQVVIRPQKLQLKKGS
jgi:short-subunit dehydrogenase